MNFLKIFNQLTTSIPHFKSIQTYLNDLALLSSIEALVAWDQETMMPSKAIAYRAQQLELLSGLYHKKLTDPFLSSFLSDHIDLRTGIPNAQDSDTVQRFVLRLYEDWRLATALPESFVCEFQYKKSLSQQAWQEARATNNFALFLPHLTEMIGLSQKKARYLATTPTLYDTLLNTYEPSLTSSVITPIFEHLKTGIMDILNTLRNKPNTPTLSMQWPIDKQALFCQKIIQDMGFDLSKGRLDISTHPFSTHINPNDARITTRYDKDRLMDALSSAMHEAGHALYEQGLLSEAFGTPFGQASSFGIHESQSRFWENFIGKHPRFWDHYFPILSDIFGPLPKEMTQAVFFDSLLKVAPSFVRVDADEVTYNIHIMIRFELEKALIDGQLDPHDLPTAWHDTYKKYLGIVPPNDTLGVLQDVHWSCGYFGYFPTYALGNIYAGMIYEHIQVALPQFDTLLQTGNLQPIRQWLQTSIHQYGRYYLPEELIQTITHSSLTPEPFLRYLKKKYVV